MRKKLALFGVAIFWGICVSAQSGNDLGRFLTNEWLQDVFPYGYEMISGTYDEDQGIYINTTIQGKPSGNYNPFCQIKTKRNGRIDQISINYSGFPNEKYLKQFARSLIQYSGARITKEDDSGNKLYLEGLISSGYSGYKTVRINSSWSYNNYGTFFLGYFDIYYIMS